TCLSIYFQRFNLAHTYASHLRNLGLFYREYLRLMAHWLEVLPIPILDVQYEELVAEPERVSRGLVEFCGLPWDERCLRFHETKRAVATASYDQVRKPIYKGSIGRWRNYEAHLGPLLEALGPELETPG
ncbi:MAG: sulfotransferase, partial [Nitrospirae bacterium]